MAKPWVTLDRAETDEGWMTLMRRGDEYVIRMEQYVLMSSRYHRSEAALATEACSAVDPGSRPRALVAGLGMGYTLRAALDCLPTGARVTVAELNPVVARWCRGPLAELTGHALGDPRVDLRIVDVAELISAAAHGRAKAYDAIMLDLYQGTHDANDDPDHPVYGRAALERARRALTPRGILAVWTESADPGFERRAAKAGFRLERRRSGRGGPRYVIYVVTRAGRRD